MKLEYQVCTLEQAKRLKELGVEAESLWIWLKNDADDLPFELMLWDDEISAEFYTYYNAYSCAELGVMLPEKIKEFEYLGFWDENGSNSCFAETENGMTYIEYSGAIHTKLTPRPSY